MVQHLIYVNCRTWPYSRPPSRCECAEMNLMCASQAADPKRSIVWFQRANNWHSTPCHSETETVCIRSQSTNWPRKHGSSNQSQLHVDIHVSFFCTEASCVCSIDSFWSHRVELPDGQLPRPSAEEWWRQHTCSCLPHGQSIKKIGFCLWLWGMNFKLCRWIQVTTQVTLLLKAQIFRDVETVRRYNRIQVGIRSVISPPFNLLTAKSAGRKRITSEHHDNHHLRIQPKNRTSWLLTGAALWEVMPSDAMCLPKRYLGNVSLHHAFNSTGSY